MSMILKWNLHLIMCMDCVELQELRLFLLMYADDFFSEGMSSFQKIPYIYTLNDSGYKTKLVAFRNAGVYYDGHKFRYCSSLIISDFKF